MANHDRSLVPVPSYLRDLYQLITLLLSHRRVAGIADFRALSEVNHEAEVNRFGCGSFRTTIKVNRDNELRVLFQAARAVSRYICA